MTLQDWGAIGEMIGGFAVLVTLIYLATQVRQASKVAWSQKTYAQASYAQQVMALQLSPDILDAVEKCYYTREPLTLRDMMLIESYIANELISARTEYLHYKKGLVDQEEWERRRSGIQPWFGADYPKFWWEYNKATFGDAFIAEVDEIITSAPEVESSVMELMQQVNRNRTEQT